MRKRPRLAGEVTHIRDFDANFFAYLAHQRLLQRLARLDESGQRAVHAGREMG